MAQDLKTIAIDENSDLARLLMEANEHPLRLVAGTASYRVTREDAAAPSDAAFDAAIDRLAGSWSVEDAEDAIEYIYRAREEGSRPATRP